MKKFAIFTFSIALVVTACKQNAGESATGRVAQGTQPAVASTTTLTSASTIYVEFAGTMSFVFPSSGTPRLVVIKGNTTFPHRTEIIIPADIKITESDLATFTGGKVKCKKACV